MLLALLLSIPTPTDPHAVYHGRAGNLDVRPPRIEAEIVVDGVLDEPAWARRLAGDRFPFDLLPPGQQLAEPKLLFKKLDPDRVVEDELGRMDAAARGDD